MPKVLKLKGTQFVAAKFRLVQDETLGTIHVFTAKDKTPVFTQNAKADTWPFLHPTVAPDGNGVLTENSPGHHKHQTGIY